MRKNEYQFWALSHRFSGVFTCLGLVLAIACGGLEVGFTGQVDDDHSTPTPDPTESVGSVQNSNLGSSVSAAPAAPSSFGALPVTFEPNQGQTNSQVKFLAKVHGYNLYLTGTDMVFDVVVQEPSVSQDLIVAPNAIVTQPGESAAVKFSLLGANPNSTAEGIQKQEGVSNYFIGNDPSRWVTDIEQYTQVLIKNIYEGINLRFYAAGNVVEHDFIVAPGGDPSVIQMQVAGAFQLFVAEDGDLEVVLNEQGTKLTVKKPIAYQTMNGSQVSVNAAYRLSGQTVGFTLGTYDQSQELVIDPVTLVFSGFLGGTLDDVTLGIALDTVSSGCTTSGSACIVTVGYTKSAAFPTASAYQGSTGGGNFDAFVTRFNSSGAGPTYSTYLGGDGDDLGYSVQIDGSGNVYITGYTTSATNFPTTGGVLQTTNAGGYDAFITKFVASGASLTYSTYFGTTGFDTGMSIALDTVSSGCTTAGSACAVIVGTSVSTTIDTAGVVNTDGDGTNGDAFVMRLNSGATAKTVGTYLGGTGGRDLGIGIAIDSSANLYVTGETRSSTFVPTPDGVDTTFGGNQEAFVVKLNAALTTASYSTYVGGGSQDGSAGIALDIVSSGCTTAGSACAVITGTTTSTDFTTANAYDTSANGETDVFISKLNSTGASYTYSTYLGGSGHDKVLGTQNIAVDANGEAWITGQTTSTEGTFPILKANIATYPGSTATAFIAKVAGGTIATDLSFVTYHGGTTSASDQGAGIAVDATASNAYVVGVAATTDFTTGGTPYDTSHNGGKDGFAAKFTTLPITVVGTPTTNTGTAITTFAVNTAIPTGTAAGDVMVQGILLSDNAATISAGPSGWTPVTDVAVNGASASLDANLYVYYKVAVDSEPSCNATFTSGSAVAGIVTLRNVNPTNALDGTATTATTTTSVTSHPAAAMTTALLNSMLITFHGVSSNTTWTPPPDDADTPGASAMDERVDIAANAGGSNNDITLEISTTIKAAAGTSLTKTATSAAGGAGAYITMALSER